MKTIVLLLALVTAFGSTAAAQKKQRIGLEEGANAVRVTGQIAGRRFALYEIYAERGDVWDIRLSSASEFIGYTVKAPNGDRYDFLEPAPQSGFYVIRVALGAAGARSKKTVQFTLDIEFELEPGRPLSGLPRAPAARFTEE